MNIFDNKPEIMKLLENEKDKIIEVICRLIIISLFWGGVNCTALAEGSNPASGKGEVHRLRFFLDQNLVGELAKEELGARLSQYANDLNTVFGKQTIRQFSFDPASDITITSTQPHTGFYIGTVPETGYEIWIYAVLTDNPTQGTYGGMMSIDESGAGVAADLKWDKIYNPSMLTDGSEGLMQYWRQIDHITHELEHVFGVGSGEFYSLSTVDDMTGVDPLQNIRKDAVDPYWSLRRNYFGDPLLNNIWNLDLVGSPTSREDLFNTVSFADVTVSVVNIGPRTIDSTMATLPDLSETKVEVLDRETALPLPGSSVTVWNVRSFPPYYNEVIAEGLTDSTGRFAFIWTPYPHVSVFSNYAHLKLIKVYAEGYKPVVKWVSIYDCQEEKLVHGMDQMIIQVELATEQQACSGDLDGDGDVDGYDLAMFAKAFGSTSGDSFYNPAGDCESNGEIGISDLTVFSRKFGKEY